MSLRWLEFKSSFSSFYFCEKATLCKNSKDVEVAINITSSFWADTFSVVFFFYMGHCVKSARIRSYSGLRENANKNNSDYGNFLRSAFSFSCTGNLQDSRRRERPCFIPFWHFHQRSQIFIHLFETLHVRWLTCIFNHIAYNYQGATRVLPLYWITILIDWWCNVSFCLFTRWFYSRFLFVVCRLSFEPGGFQLTLSITKALQVNRQTKSASHPRIAVLTKKFTAMNFLTRLHVLFHCGD